MLNHLIFQKKEKVIFKKKIYRLPKRPQVSLLFGHWMAQSSLGYHWLGDSSSTSTCYGCSFLKDRHRSPGPVVFVCVPLCLAQSPASQRIAHLEMDPIVLMSTISWCWDLQVNQEMAPLCGLLTY